MADDVGLSDKDILLAVAGIVALFAVSLPFLFVSIRLWKNSSNFSTVVYTLFVGSTGLFANARTSDQVKKVDRSLAQRRPLLGGLSGVAMPRGANRNADPARCAQLPQVTSLDAILDGFIEARLSLAFSPRNVGAGVAAGAGVPQ